MQVLGPMVMTSILTELALATINGMAQTCFSGKANSFL